MKKTIKIIAFCLLLALLLPSGTLNAQLFDKGDIVFNAGIGWDPPIILMVVITHKFRRCFCPVIIASERIWDPETWELADYWLFLLQIPL